MTVIDKNPRVELSATAPDGVKLVCAQVEGGNRSIDAPVRLPGMRGVLFSRPCAGGRGGDVYYLTVCGSGLLSRMCVADVAGHGEAVASVSAEMHASLRRLINWPDQRKFLRDLNKTLERRGLDALATAAAFTYYPPRRRLSFSYAGHPPAWFYTGADERWSRLDLDSAPDAPDELHDVALAVTPAAKYSRNHRSVATGDRLLLVTDGVLETPDGERDLFGAERVQELLEREHRLPIDALGRRLLEGLQEHAAPNGLVHDDVTFLIVEFEPPPRGHPLWHVLRNRVLRRIGLISPDDDRSDNAGVTPRTEPA